MKILVFISFLFLIFIFATASCTKEYISEYNTVEKQHAGKTLLNGVTIDNTTSGLKAPDRLRILVCEWGWAWNGSGFSWEIYYCYCYTHLLYAGNCLPEVVITAKDNLAAYNVFKAYYNKGNLPMYFSTENYGILFPDLDDLGVVDELKKGEILFYLFSEEKLGEYLYIGLPKGEEFSTTDSLWMSKTKCILSIKEN